MTLMFLSQLEKQGMAANLVHLINSRTPKAIILSTQDLSYLKTRHKNSCAISNSTLLQSHCQTN